MTLPIIIIFENHTDKAPKLLINKLLPELSNEGYDTFCTELPNNLSSNEILLLIEQTLDITKETCQMTTAGIIKTVDMEITELSDLPYSSLVHLIKTSLSNIPLEFLESLLLILTTSALSVFKENIINAQQLNMLIKGIDVEDHQDGTSNRDKSFFDEVSKLDAERNGIILLCGHSHAHALIEYFKEKGMENQLLCYYPWSSTEVAFEADFSSSANKTNENQVILSNDYDIALFANKILTDVKEKKNINEFIRSKNFPIQYLSQKYQAPFEGVLHDNYSLDALLKVDESMDTMRIKKDLEANNIQSHYSFFKDKEHLVIRNINHKEVHEKINKIVGFS